ncbi:MAG: AAA family ATPase [Planctomycetota bacterium]
MKTPDDNDMLRSGGLPGDPFEGATPVGPNGGPPLPWRTLRELADAGRDKPRVWLVPSLIPFGSVTIVSGHAKRAGKTTFVWILVAAAAKGARFLGVDVARTSAVIVSEEADVDLTERLALLGLEDARSVVLSRGALREAVAWRDLVVDAVGRAHAIGARILVVDTFAHWARLEQAAENDAGAITEAVRVLQAAADAGLAVLLVHHTGKRGEGDGVLSMRGSSALAGAVEGVLEIRPVPSHPDRRSFLLESRHSGRRELVAELAPSRNDYVLVGDAVVVEADETKAEVVAFLDKTPGWHPLSAVAAAVRGKPKPVSTALKALAEAGAILRHGRGVKGDPVMFAKVGTIPPVCDVKGKPKRPIDPPKPDARGESSPSPADSDSSSRPLGRKGNGIGNGGDSREPGKGGAGR